MSPRSLRIWTWLHTWSSLVCTVFMLLLCLTGLPLIFHHEIGHLLGTEVEAPQMPADTAPAPLDVVVASAQARAPGLVPTFVFQAPDERDTWTVSLAPTPMAQEGTKTVVVDARTGQVLGEPPAEEGFLYVMFKLHVDLFAGLPGKLFLGLMGLLLVLAIVSGAVLYAPFMRKLPFGTVRRGRSARLKWLDLHNLLGVVTLSWALVVGFTGVINTWAGLYKPVLVDAQTAQVTDVLDPPWYVTALLVSQPLHFGDYGGRPMQVLWAVLDVITIVVLCSGLVLWFGRRRAREDRPLGEALPAAHRASAR